MADLGAEVIHLEPPRTGDDARRSPPFPQDVPHPEKSGLFLFLNTNKLGITLDPQLPRGKKIFEQLVRNVDVLVEDWPPKQMERMGLGYDDLRQLNPGLIMASITPFGRSGPFEDYRAHALNISQVSGQGYLLPLPSPHLERAPTMVGGQLHRLRLRSDGCRSDPLRPLLERDHGQGTADRGIQTGSPPVVPEGGSRHLRQYR